MLPSSLDMNYFYSWKKKGTPKWSEYYHISFICTTCTQHHVFSVDICAHHWPGVWLLWYVNFILLMLHFCMYSYYGLYGWPSNSIPFSVITVCATAYFVFHGVTSMLIWQHFFAVCHDSCWYTRRANHWWTETFAWRETEKNTFVLCCEATNVSTLPILARSK